VEIPGDETRAVRARAKAVNLGGSSGRQRETETFDFE
jgi:hypothetical protein